MSGYKISDFLHRPDPVSALIAKEKSEGLNLKQCAGCRKKFHALELHSRFCTTCHAREFGYELEEEQS